MRKLLINLVMLILAFTIQICVFPQIAFLSSAPNLLLIVVFVCSFIEGRERGMFYGLVAGLFMDLFYSGPFGFYTLFFINLGYVSGICNKYYYEDYITLPLLLSLASDLIYNLYIYVFRFLIRNGLHHYPGDHIYHGYDACRIPVFPFYQPETERMGTKERFEHCLMT